MRRVGALFVISLILAACSSDGGNTILRQAGAVVAGLVPKGQQAAAMPSNPITRAEIERADIAAIGARLIGDPTSSLLNAVSSNGGYITYASAFGQLITLKGGKITATRGLGTDLLSSWSDAADPIATPLPLAQWPGSVTRSYEFPAAGPRGRVETYTCRFELPGPSRAMVILERRHLGREISEICEGPAGIVENLYFVEPDSGFIWRSVQWIGPDMDPLDIEIFEPLDK